MKDNLQIKRLDLATKTKQLCYLNLVFEEICITLSNTNAKKNKKNYTTTFGD